MRQIRVHSKAIVLTLNRSQADALMYAVTSHTNGPYQYYGGMLVLGKDTTAIRRKLEAAIKEVQS